MDTPPFRPSNSMLNQYEYLGIVSQDPCDSKFSRLQVDIIFRFCFHSFGVYSSLDSSNMSVKLLQSWTSTGYFSNSTTSFVTNRWFFPSSVLVITNGHFTHEPRAVTAWPYNGDDPWLSSKGHTMGVGKAVLCSHGPSNIVWSENGPCFGTITYFVGRKRREDLG